MASVYNQVTGEWEEQEDTGPNAFSTQGATAMGPGLSGLYSNQPSQSTGSFISPIDNQSYPTEYTGEKTSMINNPYATPGYGSGSGENTQGFQANGVLTNAPGQELAYSSLPEGWNQPNWSWGGEAGWQGGGNVPTQLETVNPDFEKWNSNYWAALHPEEYQARQAASNSGTGLFDMGLSLATSDIMAPARMAVGAYLGGLNSGSLEGIFGSGGGETLAGESFGGIGDLLGDSSYWGAIDSINPNLALETGSAALAAPTSVTNMGLGLQNLAQLGNGPTWNASPWNPESTSLGDATTSSLGVSPEAEASLDSRFTGGDPFETQSLVNKDYNSLTGYGLDNAYGKGITGLPMGTEGSLKNMWDKLTTPMGGKQTGLLQKPSPLSMGVRALGSLDSWSQGKRAQEMLEEQMNRSRGMGDQNAARGSFANNEWMKTQSDPMYGYGSFMQGAGRDFVNNARAAAAKSGNRGGYLNTGRMNSDLASLWQKNQTQRAQSLTGGFASDPYAASNSITPAYANLVKNQNAPLFQGLEGGMKAFQLADLFGGD